LTVTPLGHLPHLLSGKKYYYILFLIAYDHDYYLPLLITVFFSTIHASSRYIHNGNFSPHVHPTGTLSTSSTTFSKEYSTVCSIFYSKRSSFIDHHATGSFASSSIRENILLLPSLWIALQSLNGNSTLCIFSFLREKYYYLLSLIIN
jgi:hypothetical protein